MHPELQLAQDWIVAATIATEVPPEPRTSPPSTVAFTAPMIIAAQQAVAEVIWNRTKDPRFPNTPVAVVLSPLQFSAVMRGLSAKALGHKDIWLGALEGSWCPQHVEDCLTIWRMVKSNSAATPVVPIVPGACWYYSPVSMRPAFTAPAWAAGKTEIIAPVISGDYFRFFK